MLLLIVGLTVISCNDKLPYRAHIDQNKIVDDEVPEEPEKISRPSNAVIFKNDFCACKDRKPISYGNCSSFCASRSTGGAETLYASFNVTEAISLSGLGNVDAWCNTLLPEDTQNPICYLEAKDEQGNVSEIIVNNIRGSNSITANIQDAISFDKTYVLTLVERFSKARSNSIQMIKFSTDINLTNLGPIKVAPISQYTCVIRESSEDDVTGDIFYNSAYRIHFYYLPKLPPAPIPPGTSNIVCHDMQDSRYGRTDDVLYPRLETLPGVFSLWDTTDPRFYNNNGDPQNILDINEIIAQKTRNFGGNIPVGTNFFSQFRWPGSPALSSDTGNNSAQTQPIGYYMAPWVDSQTFKSYCLTSAHYNSNNALFKAMRDIIGVDTEGLYIGEKSPETVVNPDGTVSSGQSDYILITESDLKAVWFHLKNNVPTFPTDTNVSNVAVYFYYPLNKNTPHIKTSTQATFRVRAASELGNNGSTGVSGNTASETGGTTNYPPHDRKIGCVPKL
ncbi:MAG TPA: hypothetical protein VNJ01_08140 [Bacteriovoracaceae bacterium]|nr:hypothetical protein [Bacteriovoracaceae bacterium]